MKFNIKEDDKSEMEDNIDSMKDQMDGKMKEDFDDYAEIEMVAAEPTKVTDIDGSVVLVSPGDTLTIKSESLKRIKTK